MIPKSEVGVTSFDRPSDREVTVTRTFAAPATLIFDCWTVPEHVRSWMLGPEGWTMEVCEIDLRPGGAWRFGWRREDGSEMELTGEYREVERPHRLVNTERWGAEWPETVNTLVLTEEDGTTLSVLTLLYPSREARDAAMETGAESGIEESYRRLEAHLAALV